MTQRKMPGLALRIIILFMLTEAIGFAAPAHTPEPAEVIAAPAGQAPLPPGLARDYAEAGQILGSPTLTENPQPPPIQPAQPAESDQTLPINLATALVFVECPAIGDCLCPSERGRGGRSASERQSPLVAEPQCGHGLLPPRRNGSDDQRHDDP